MEVLHPGDEFKGGEFVVSLGKYICNRYECTSHYRIFENDTGALLSIDKDACRRRFPRDYTSFRDIVDFIKESDLEITAEDFRVQSLLIKIGDDFYIITDRAPFGSLDYEHKILLEFAYVVEADLIRKLSQESKSGSDNSLLGPL